MFVCSTGGHLWEMLHWSQRLDPAPDSAVWVTHDRANAYQITLLDPAADVHYVRPVEPKQAGAATAVIGSAWRLLARTRPDLVISTGAAVAVPFAVAARARGIPFHYLESAARISAPSLTGKMIQRISTQTPWCQTEPWPGWRYAGSMFDAYEQRPDDSVTSITRVAVALGTQANFGFRRAVEAITGVLTQLPAAPEVFWQVGSTDVTGLGVADPRPTVPEPELAAAMADADVVITHAGVGLASMALDSGHVPVLLPRRAARAEHTDDHQTELAAALGRRGLAVPAEADALTMDQPVSARRRRVARRGIDELPRWNLPERDARRVRARS